MPKGIKGFVKGHPLYMNPESLRGRIPWNKGKKGIQKAWNKGKKLSGDHRVALSQAKIGKYVGNRSWNWKGGLSPVVKLIRQSENGVRWRQQIFLRDNFTCRKCGAKGVRLEAHHKKSFSILLREAISYLPLFTPYEAAMNYPPLWDIDNGLTLCEKCHDKVKHLVVRHSLR